MYDTSMRIVQTQQFEFKSKQIYRKLILDEAQQQAKLKIEK